MANRKYEFTGQTKEFLGRTLKQIRAIVSFGTVVQGEIGGWIEAEANLQVSGNAWVYGNAWVSDNARVSGNARVYDNARVSGDAQVYGDADFLLIGPLGSRGDPLCIHADLKLGVRFTTGCFSGTELQLKEAISKTHGDNEYAKQYRAAIELASLVVRPAKAEKKEAA